MNSWSISTVLLTSTVTTYAHAYKSKQMPKMLSFLLNTTTVQLLRYSHAYVGTITVLLEFRYIFSKHLPNIS